MENLSEHDDLLCLCLKQFFGLDEKDWLSEMIKAGKSFCGEEWSKLKEKYPTTKEKYLDGYCFSSAYIISLLHDSLGFALDDDRYYMLLHKLIKNS